MRFTQSFPLLSTLVVGVAAFPGFIPGAQDFPTARTDHEARRVNDYAHRYIAPRPNDMRGPCPALNALANHGWLPRNGVATPAQIINAAQDGFNLGYELACSVTSTACCFAHLVNGNQLTNLLSIGGKTPLTGPDPIGQPAKVGGLSNHGTMEGDASLTRVDKFFGSNSKFNNALFHEMETAAAEVGNGNYNAASAALLRFRRIEQSKATNPIFDFTSPRYTSAYGESTIAILNFADGRRNNSDFVPIDEARLFFKEGRMPDGYWRREGQTSNAVLGPVLFGLLTAYPTQPGKNNGAGNFIADPNDLGLGAACLSYNKTVISVHEQMYPSPRGALKKALIKNLDNFYRASFPGASGSDCPQRFPYGRT